MASDVNALREMFAAHHPITVVTSERRGTRTYGRVCYECAADLPWKQDDVPAALAAHHADLAAERVQAARAEGGIAALEEAADERGELWSGPPGTSVCYDCAEKVATWLHGRAADYYARVAALRSQGAEDRP